jgi:hypothetical protein
MTSTSHLGTGSNFSNNPTYQELTADSAAICRANKRDYKSVELR